LLLTGLAAALPAHADVEKTSMAFPAIAPIFASSWIAQDAGIYKQVGLEVSEQVIQGIGSTNAASGSSSARKQPRHIISIRKRRLPNARRL
jgi:hypothetical protein